MKPIEVISILEEDENLRYDIIEWLDKSGYLDDFKIDNLPTEE